MKEQSELNKFIDLVQENLSIEFNYPNLARLYSSWAPTFTYVWFRSIAMCILASSKILSNLTAEQKPIELSQELRILREARTLVDLKNCNLISTNGLKLAGELPSLSAFKIHQQINFRNCANPTVFLCLQRAR